MCFTSVLPTTYIDGALYIMSLLRRHSHEISWTSTGEVSFQGVPSLGSNIIVLLSYVLRAKIKYPKGPPIGVKRFMIRYGNALYLQ
jgi:hypothetical protein